MVQGFLGLMSTGKIIMETFMYPFVIAGTDYLFINKSACFEVEPQHGIPPNFFDPVTLLASTKNCRICGSEANKGLLNQREMWA